MARKRRWKAAGRKQEESHDYLLRVVDFTVSYSFSVRKPEQLSRLEVNHTFRGVRPEEPVVTDTVCIELAFALLQPQIKGITHGRYSIYCQDEGHTPHSAGLLDHDKTFLTGLSFLPAPTIQILLVLLCTGQRLYLNPTATKFRYGKARVLHLEVFTENHEEIISLLSGIYSK